MIFIGQAPPHEQVRPHRSKEDVAMHPHESECWPNVPPVLSETIGIILLTPSSVAFCRMISIGFFLTKQIANSILDLLVDSFILFRNFLYSFNFILSESFCAFKKKFCCLNHSLYSKGSGYSLLLLFFKSVLFV